MKNYENFKRDALKEIFIKFLQNASNEKEKKYILTIIDNINWYWTKSMYEFFSEFLIDNFDENSILIDFSTDDSSSSKGICTYLANSVIVANDILRIEDCQKLSSSINKIFLVDDFIGSGNTILEHIRKLEENGYENKKIYILSYIALEKGKNNIENFESKKNKISLIINILEKNYLQKNFEQDLIDYITSICNRCRKIGMEFGYEACGSMLSINGTSSNNNLSLLYSDDIDNWNKLLDRDINLVVLSQKRSKIIKENRGLIAKYYFDNKVLKKTVSLKEFELLILLYDCFGMDIELLKKFNFFATIKECEEVFKSLQDKKILKEGFFIEIIDKNILQFLKKFNKKIDNDFIKKTSKKFY